MIESLLGTLFGGFFRIAPEVLKWVDKKNERQHELAMREMQIQADTLKGEYDSRIATVQAEASVTTADIQALIEATRVQGNPIGVKWADALNAIIRPVLAFQWLIFLWPAVVLCGFIGAINAGTDPLEALDKAFGIHEQALASSIASFWLVDRSLRHKNGTL